MAKGRGKLSYCVHVYDKSGGVSMERPVESEVGVTVHLATWGFIECAQKISAPSLSSSKQNPLNNTQKDGQKYT